MSCQNRIVYKVSARPEPQGRHRPPRLFWGLLRPDQGSVSGEPGEGGGMGRQDRIMDGGMDAVGTDDGVGAFARVILESQLYLVLILDHVDATVAEAEHLVRQRFPQHVEKMCAVHCVVRLAEHPLALVA